jgi:hypothetical protein
VAEYRLRNDALLERLGSLVPDYLAAVPADPFDDGEPIRYRIDAGGFHVCSIGENGVDDGGSTKPGPTPPRPLDIVFRVE